jgi:hypothetical protein
MDQRTGAGKPDEVLTHCSPTQSNDGADASLWGRLSGFWAMLAGIDKHNHEIIS